MAPILGDRETGTVAFATDRRGLVMAPVLRYREAGPDDADLVFDMLMHAANWDPGREALTRDQVAGEPKLAHYAARWPRPGDLGFVAVDEEALGRGAAWLRYFSGDDPSYGFVDAQTPELSIGVDAAVRGMGTGTELCRRLFHAADARGIPQVSLSVEKANPAAALYQRLGFVVVRDDGDAVTMVRHRPRTP
jgi:ribosomal protein S18 acetylase RimI-like enzyme